VLAYPADDYCYMSRRSARIIGGIGRTFIGAGILVMAFAFFQLWGTGLQEERAQGNLSSEFEAQLALVNRLAAEADLAATNNPASDEPDSTPLQAESLKETPVNNQRVPGPNQPQSQDQIEKAPVLAPELAEALIPKAGDAMGRIEIPALDLTKAIVQGVRRADLRDAPGHYPDSVYPGQAGNAAIAGHRTTYGSPFGDLDKLVPGDSIVVETLQGKFYYEVLPQVDPATGYEIGHQIVSPYDVSVLDDKGDNRLTLTACHPKYSARERIVVAAKLVSEPAEPLPELAPVERPVDDTPDDLAFDSDPSTIDPGEASSVDLDKDGQLSSDEFEASLGWQMGELPTVLMWALGTFMVGLAGYVAGRKWRRIPAYAATTLPFLAMLWVCFEHLDRLLPAF